MKYKTPDSSKKLRMVKMLLFDADGVMTDGKIVYSGNGEEIKSFCVKDGLGIRLVMDAGIDVGVVTGRRSEALRHRCKNLRIEYLFEGVSDKAAVLDTIIEMTGIQASEIAYIGDDLPDISIMKKTGIPIAVADAHENVIETACIVTSAEGGKGAIREVCEAILKFQGKWNPI